MALPLEASNFKEALILLGSAAVVVPAFHRLKISPVLGFLVMGLLLGPGGLAPLAKHFPWLEAVTISDSGRFAFAAELGVIFLMFMVGLGLSIKRLKTMRVLVFGMGFLKLAAASLAIGLCIAAMGGGPREVIIIGISLAMSSTALVLQLLADQKRLATGTGRASFAVLLFEDLAVLPLLVLISVLAQPASADLGASLGSAALKAAVAIAAILLIGRFALRPVFRGVAETKSPELFMAACLLVITVTSFVTALSGLSMALGAFLGGLLLAETEFRREIEVTIEPFKGLLIGVFFFSVGLSLDTARIIAEPLLAAGAVLGLAVIKAAVTFPVLRLFRVSQAAALEAALLLSSAGEFSFVALGLAVTAGVINSEAGGFALMAGTLSLALLPLIAPLARRFSRRAGPAEPLPAGAEAVPEGAKAGQVIIAGFGRVGQLVASLLDEHEIPYLAIDSDAKAVAAARRAGKPVFYGNADRTEFLERCGIAASSAVVVTMDSRAAVEAVAAAVRQARPDIVLVARARDRAHARALYAGGVTEAVPEAFEASLHLAEASLIGAGVPLGKVIASVHERRDRFRAEFQTIDRGGARGGKR